MGMPLELQVLGATPVAQDVLQLDLVHAQRLDLPAASPGSHIDLQLGNGLVRQYSVVNEPGERRFYRIAVRLDAQGRGGSRWVHASLRAGSSVRASAPRCNFPLVPDAVETLLIAGGIGVTPLLSMAYSLRAAGRRWRFVYCARTPTHAAYLDEVRRIAAPGQLVECFDEGMRERMLDLPALVAAQAPHCHLYCCGPAPMLQAFEGAARGRDPATVHVEHFTAPAPSAATGDTAFLAVLARSGITVQVAAEQSLLQALLDARIDIPCSCLSGICGTCETKVLEGEPEHRDSVLNDHEKREGRSMMPCVSRSRGPSITLDL